MNSYTTRLSRKYVWVMTIVFSGIILNSCTDEESEPDENTTKETIEVVDQTLSTDFNANTFTSNTEVELLKELKLCDPTAPTDTDEKRPTCSPKFFRFFQLSKKIPLNNAFILLIKAGVNDFPLRRVLVFQREKDQLIKLNGFNGNIIEKRKTTSGYDDLVIRFADNIEGQLCYYNCIFSWNGGQYEYKYCQDIDDRKVKAEFIDSMAPEILTILQEKQLVF